LVVEKRLDVNGCRKKKVTKKVVSGRWLKKEENETVDIVVVVDWLTSGEYT